MLKASGVYFMRGTKEGRRALGVRVFELAHIGYYFPFCCPQAKPLHQLMLPLKN